MDWLIGIAVFLLLLFLLPERKSRIERLREEAFPKDRWSVHESFDEPGKWAMFRGGIEYKQYDTRALAVAHKEELDRIGC